MAVETPEKPEDNTPPIQYALGRSDGLGINLLPERFDTRKEAELALETSADENLSIVEVREATPRDEEETSNVR